MYVYYLMFSPSTKAGLKWTRMVSSAHKPFRLLCCHLAHDYSRCSAQDNASNVNINQKCLYVGHEAQMEADDTVMVEGRNVWESTQVISFFRGCHNNLCYRLLIPLVSLFWYICTSKSKVNILAPSQCLSISLLHSLSSTHIHYAALTWMDGFKMLLWM